MSASAVFFSTDEPVRQQAVDRSGVLRLAGDRQLAAIADEAASLYGTPIAAISVITGHRQILISRTGIDVDETTREGSFCATTIHTPGEPMVIRDTRHDARFRCHPLVIAAPHLRFYAGMPIMSRDGYALGALCVADIQPHGHPIDTTSLSMLARQVERRLWR